MLFLIHRSIINFCSRGEYFCPLCRQLANSVLPLSPQLGECTAVVRSRPGSMSAIINELTNFLKDNQRTPVSKQLFNLIFYSTYQILLLDDL